MSTPLIDIDANPQQPGFRAIKDGSKIPSPPKFQRPGRTSGRSPFSVSITGSPCYTVMPPATKVVASPTPTSRLPRKSTPTQGAFSKSYTYGTGPATPRSSLSRSRAVLEQSAIAVPLSSDSNKMTPSMSCNKPLPSPPIAQLVNPQSPPKAQRTLVDAEAGSPTEDEWPILQPENISFLKAFALPKSDGLPQRSISEGSVLRRNGIPMLKSRVTTPSSVENRIPSQKSSLSTGDDDSSQKKFRQMMEPRTLSLMNPYANAFHAFSTNTELATGTLQTVADIVPPVQTPTEELKDHKQQHLVEATHDDLAFPDPTSRSESLYGSIDSISLGSLAARICLDNEPEDHYEGSVRVKRLSTKPYSGPTLRISPDADAVLLGRDDTFPAILALSNHVCKNTLQKRSLGTLAGQFSREVLGKMVPGTGSRSLTPSSGEMEGDERKPVKVTPIRSMQPPRKPNTEDLSKSSTSPVGIMPIEIGQDEQETGNYSTTLQVEIPQKAGQVLGTDGGLPKLAARKLLPMTWMAPKSAASTARNDNAKRSKTSPLLSSTERSYNRASTSSSRPPRSSSSNLARSNPPHADAYLPGRSRSGTTSKPPNANDCSERAHNTEQNAAEAASKIKAKRSFRDIFHRRNPKSTPQPANKTDSKRTSVVGSVVTQRTRNLTHFSKVSLAGPCDASSEVEQNIATSLSNGTAGIESKRQATPAAIDPNLPDNSPRPAPVAQYDTATVVHKILDHVTSMEVDCPDRLRGIEIAEAVLHAVECSQEAKMGAELASKHARDAEASAKRAGVELKRLVKLCEPGFDLEALQAINQLIADASVPELSGSAEK
ncbi:hypothetical protein N0V95_009395 [Ascochyta clinopodiicola]|nr:hypothetical protein N0V95_009395 [Ascochyta clinopodiicola]